MTDAPAAASRRAPTRNRYTWLVVAILGPALAAAVLVMAFTWPSGVHQVARDAGLVDPDVQYLNAVVVGTPVLKQCEGTIEDVQPDGTVPSSVACLHVKARIAAGEEQGREVDIIAPARTQPEQVPDGTKIIVERYPPSDSLDETWAWSDFERSIPLGTLALAFVVVAGIVAGWRGLRAVLGLAIAAVVLWMYLVPALLTGRPAVLAGLAASVLILTVVVYFAHGVSMRSSTALLGTFAGLLLVLGIGTLGAAASRLSYVATEDDYRLASMLGDNGVATLHGVFLCGVVLAGLGVLNDVTITQASAVWELRAADPAAGWRGLFTGGMRIGRDHIASTIYTIVFAYAGASLPVLLLLQLYDLPVLRTLTAGAFAEEVVRTLAGAIGLILAIPFTTAIAASVALAGPPQRGGAGHVHAH